MVSKKMKTITFNKRNWKSLLTLLTLIVLIPATMNAADTWESTTPHSQAAEEPKTILISSVQHRTWQV